MEFNNYEAYENIEIEKTEPELPTFTTPQTQRLRNEYPEIEQLESGDIGAWLQERKEQLWEKATELEFGCNAAKSISLAVAGVGTICYATSPFAPIGAAVAGIAYVWTLFEDTNHTKKFAPVPFIKGNFLEFLNAMGDAGARDEYFSSQNSDAETLLHLDKPEQKEYLFLYESFEKVTNYLENTEPGKRFYAYRWLLGAYSKFRALPTTQSYKNHLNQVAIAIDVDYDRVNQLHERRANTQLPPQVQRQQSNNHWQGKEIDICTGEYVDAQPLYQEQQARLEPTREVKGFGKKQPVATDANNAPTRIQSSQPTVIQTRVDVYNPTGNNSIDLIGELTDELNNLFIVGLGGSGKGILTANALRAIKALHGKKIFLINGKVDPKEAGYFEGVVDVEKRLHCESATPSAVATWFEAAVAEYDQFAAENNGALLIIDEGTIIGARLKAAKSTALGDKLIGITSCGGSQGKNVWFIAQTPYVGANGGDLSSISQLTPIAIVSHKNLAVLDTWKRASIFKKFDGEEISKLVKASECLRAVYFGKNAQWYSMPVLNNYSAFNRDTGEIIGEIRQPKTTVQQLEDSFKADSSSRKKKVDFNSPEWADFFSDDDIDEEVNNLSAVACEILDYISKNQPVTKEALKKWCNRNGFNLDKRKPAIQELIESELIKFEDGAFKPAGQ